jgi:hypothetical protein
MEKVQGTKRDNRIWLRILLMNSNSAILESDPHQLDPDLAVALVVEQRLAALAVEQRLAAL